MDYEPGPRNFRYDLSTMVNGEVRYTRSGLVLLHHARWRRTFWSGDEPRPHVAHDIRYLIAIGVVPSYDPVLIVAVGSGARVGGPARTGLDLLVPAGRPRFPVPRMGFGTAYQDDYCWIFGAAYRLRVARDADGPMFQTIREVYRSTNGQRVSGSESFPGYADSPSGYPANMQPALAAAVDSYRRRGRRLGPFRGPRGQAGLPDYPVWAVVPRAMHAPPRGR